MYVYIYIYTYWECIFMYFLITFNRFKSTETKSLRKTGVRMRKCQNEREIQNRKKKMERDMMF